MKHLTQIEAKRKLAASIQNERRTYNQNYWTTGDANKLPKCGTASCLAGHIEALWPRVAKRLAPLYTETRKSEFTGHTYHTIMHAKLAAAVWKEVTGAECRFDFDLSNMTYAGFEPTDRDAAVAHIWGRNRKWPLHSKSKE
jgi:hypothetical protein